MDASSDSIARANFLWGHAVARYLADFGVRQVFFSPGSRSTPLVLGCEREPRLSCLGILDERSAGFVALGNAKRSGLPVALISTSGSAPSHWYPAVTEAHYSGVPLLLLSADRPPELQECASGQTINQNELFGCFVRGFHPVCLPAEERKDLIFLQKILRAAFAQTRGRESGPVHLNFPFREPLWPDGSNLPDLSLIPPLIQFDENPSKKNSLPLLPQDLSKHSRTVIVCGIDCPSALPASFRTAPLICDSLCELREHEHPNRILRYEHLLGDERFLKSAKPDLFLVLGPLPTSKTLRSWIERSGVRRIVIEPSERKVDPLSGPSETLKLDFEELDLICLPSPEIGWLSKWTEADRETDLRLDEIFRDLPFDSEPKIARILSETLPPRCLLHVANSMPIRDLEWFWKPSDRQRRLFGARGVNGIDGTLGTAMGLAQGCKEPVFLLTGELAFLHDSNSLLLSSLLDGSLTVILVNNNGGGIFERLSVASLPEFEKCFATPQKCDFSSLCAAHGVDHLLCGSENELRKEISAPIPRGLRVLEVRCDRKKDQETRRRLLSFPLCRS